MSGAEPDHRTASAEDFAIYVTAMAGELARLARGHGFGTLGYLLEMVRLEARGTTRKPVSRRSSKVAATPEARLELGTRARALTEVVPERR